MGRKQLTMLSRLSGRAVIKRRIIIVYIPGLLSLSFERSGLVDDMRDREKDTGTKTRDATKAIKSHARGIVTAVAMLYLETIDRTPALPPADTRRGFRDEFYFAGHPKARKLYESLQFRD